MELAIDQFGKENVEANFVFKSELAKREYFAKKRKIIRTNSFATRANMALVFTTFAISIAMVVVGKIILFFS